MYLDRVFTILYHLVLNLKVRPTITILVVILYEAMDDNYMQRILSMTLTVILISYFSMLIMRMVSS